MNLRVLCPAAAILVTATSVHAADMRGSIPSASFEGLYVGGFGGYGAAKIEGIQDSREIVDCDGWAPPTCPEEAEVFDGDWRGSAIFGGYLGYNIKYSGFILGVEGDISVGELSDRAEDYGANDYATQDVEWLGSVRGRLGMLTGEATMFYATGGVGYISTVYSAFNNVDEPSRENSKENIGAFTAVAGGGVEHLVNEHVAIRFEGLYFFPTSEHDFNEEELTDDMDEGDYAKIGGVHQVRAGLSFKF